jgi:hypothetical protein
MNEINSTAKCHVSDISPNGQLITTSHNARIWKNAVVAYSKVTNYILPVTLDMRMYVLSSMAFVTVARF